MKRTLSLVLALLMILCAYVPVFAAGEALEKVTLKFYFPDEKRAMFDEVWTAIAEKTRDTLNVDFDITFVGWDDYANKIQMLSASGDTFDGYFDASWLTYNQMMAKGGLLNIKPLMEQYMPKYTKRLNEVGMIDPILVNGGLYCIPWDVPKSERSTFGYRADLAEKYGVDLSGAKTIEDLEPFLAAIKANEPGLMPTYWDRGSGANFFSHVIKSFMLKYEYDMVGDGFVYSLRDPECKVIPFEQTDAFREAMVLIRRWYELGYIPKNMMSISYQEDPFKTGKAASQWSATDIAFNVQPFQNVEGARKEAVLLYPDKLCYNASPLGNLFCINKNAANPERVLMFIELLSTDREVYDMVLYGIEGETYVLKGDQASFPEGMDGGSSTYVDWSGQWGFWRRQFLRPTDTDTAETYRKQDELLALPTAVNGKLTSFTPFTDEIKVELAKRDSIADEEFRILEFGVAEDVNKAVDDYIEHQKAAGVDKILVEMQKQVDEYIKR